jgi:hypothetical protein
VFTARYELNLLTVSQVNLSGVQRLDASDWYYNSKLLIMVVGNLPAQRELPH